MVLSTFLNYTCCDKYNRHQLGVATLLDIMKHLNPIPFKIIILNLKQKAENLFYCDQSSERNISKIILRPSDRCL